MNRIRLKKGAMMGKLVIYAGLMLAIGVFCNPLVSADIYYYVDPRGVYHFTNTPTSKKYRLYMRSSTQRVSRPSATAYNYRFKGDYDRLIEEAARKYNVDFALVKSMIKVESDFNPAAVSPKGAQGLMQIIPDNFSALGIVNPFDPYENIMGGTRFFKQMLDRFGGQTNLALAAYNAGPGAVERNRNQIPAYPETRDYVRKVLHYYDYLAQKN